MSRFRRARLSSGARGIGLVLLLALLLYTSWCLFGQEPRGEETSPAVIDGDAEVAAPQGEDTPEESASAAESASGDEVGRAAASLATFMDILEQDGAQDAPEGASTSVSWRESRDIVEAACGVLEAYREVESVDLVTSGYVDLAGNVWAALLSDGKGWVDMVTIEAGENDEGSTVTVVRLRASAAPSL